MNPSREMAAIRATTARWWRWLMLGLVLLSACTREVGPEAIALQYARSLYAADLAQAYRLLSAEDQRAKDEQTFIRERGGVSRFALEVTRRLASFIEATQEEKTIRGERATIRLRLRLPDANAAEIVPLVLEWDERRLNALSQTERETIIQDLDRLHREHRIPMIEGDETFELVREASGWRVFLNWMAAVRVRFRTTVSDAIPIRVTVSPEQTTVKSGEQFQVTVRVKNLSSQDVVTRVGHRIEPKVFADSLALLQCPLFIPVTLHAGQTQEFVSEYLLLKDAPPDAKQFQVTYEFRQAK